LNRKFSSFNNWEGGEKGGSILEGKKKLPRRYCPSAEKKGTVLMAACSPKAKKGRPDVKEEGTASCGPFCEKRGRGEKETTFLAHLGGRKKDLGGIPLHERGEGQGGEGELSPFTKGEERIKERPLSI